MNLFIILELYLEQPLTQPQHKIIIVFCILNHRLAIETGQRSTIPIHEDNKLIHLCSYNVVENKAHFMAECPLYNSIRYRFHSLLQNEALDNLKSFFPLDHHIEISLLSHGDHCTLLF